MQVVILIKKSLGAEGTYTNPSVLHIKVSLKPFFFPVVQERRSSDPGEEPGDHQDQAEGGPDAVVPPQVQLSRDARKSFWLKLDQAWGKE